MLQIALLGFIKLLLSETTWTPPSPETVSAANAIGNNQRWNIAVILTFKTSCCFELIDDTYSLFVTVSS